MAGEQFSLCWDNFHKNMSSGMHSLLESEDLVDVTLAVEGKYLKAHKMVLSVCSPYFRELFQMNPCKHPIVFMKDVSYTAMSDLLTFMYQGEVQVNQEQLTTFIKTAEALQIKGLTSDGNNDSTEVPDDHTEKVVTKTSSETIDILENDVVPKSVQKTKKPASYPPPVKRQRTSSPSRDRRSPVTILKGDTIAQEQPQSTEQLIHFKMEPYEADQSDQTQMESYEENPDDTFGDDGVDDTHIDDTEYTMLKGEEEPQAGTSGDGMGESQESLDPANITAPDIIPVKSRERYELVHREFAVWCQHNKIETVSENVLLKYFMERGENLKPSSLWAVYSILKTTLRIMDNIDIREFSKLANFLKRKKDGYRAKKSKIFTRDDFYKFLKEAEDETYLMIKVAFIFGIFGACRRDELTNVLTDDIEDHGPYLIVNILDTRTQIRRNFTITCGDSVEVNLLELYHKYAGLRPLHTDHQRFFLNYRFGKCSTQVVGINTFGKFPQKIAEYLKLPDPSEYTGHCFRKSSAGLLGNLGGTDVYNLLKRRSQRFK